MAKIVVVPDHPELDRPDGDVPWADYVDGISRLDLKVRDLIKRKQRKQE